MTNENTNVQIRDHSALVRRIVITGKLTARTAIHVGQGREIDPTSVDSVVVRDGFGQPYIPGSSFKGVLRSTVESIVRGLAHSEIWACDPFADKTIDNEKASCSKRVEEALNALKSSSESERVRVVWKESCSICRIFGCSSFAGRIRIDDMPILGEFLSVEVRNGVGIDRDRRIAKSGVLYDYEAVPTGTCFKLRISLDNPSDDELGLISAGLSALHDGFAAIGGKGTRGLGSVGVLLNTPTERKASDFFKKLAPLPKEIDGSEEPDIALASYLEAARKTLVPHLQDEGR